MNSFYIGSGENANNKNRLETHLYELFNKITQGGPLTMTLNELMHLF